MAGVHMMMFLYKYYGGTIDKSNVNYINLLTELLLMSRLDQSRYTVKYTTSLLLGSKLLLGIRRGLILLPNKTPESSCNLY